VIREYSDQRELVTLAHTRLAVSMPTPTGMTSRRLASVPIGGVGYGTVSPDGRYFPHTRWDSGDLYVRDLVTGGDRRITDGGGLGAESPSPTGEFATHAAFSRDGKQLAYAWWIGASVELRIVPLLTERVVMDLDDKHAARKAEKWQQVAVEVIKQCGAAWLGRRHEGYGQNGVLAFEPRKYDG